MNWLKKQVSTYKLRNIEEIPMYLSVYGVLYAVGFIVTQYEMQLSTNIFVAIESFSLHSVIGYPVIALVVLWVVSTTLFVMSILIFNLFFTTKDK